MFREGLGMSFGFREDTNQTRDNGREYETTHPLKTTLY